MIKIFSKHKYSTKFRKHRRSLSEGINARSIETEEKQLESLHKSMQKLKKHEKLHSLNVEEETFRLCSRLGISV